MKQGMDGTGSFDAGAARKKIVTGLRAYGAQAGLSRGVVGVSGGVDSATVLSLAVEALGKENVTALLMPEEGITPQDSVSDAKAFCVALGVEAIESPINDFVEAFAELPWKQSDLARANLRARTRAVLLYSFANSHGCLVLGTGNKTELTLGYFTKYGDGAVDLEVIGGLWKGQVFALAKELGVPQAILEKTPSAELWLGQTDEEELGAPYPAIDRILAGLDAGKTAEALAEEGSHPRLVKKIQQKIAENRHKSQPLPCLDV